MKKPLVLILLYLMLPVFLYSQAEYTSSAFENSWVYIPNSDMQAISPTTFENSQHTNLPAPPPYQPPATTPPPTGTQQPPPGAPAFQFPFLPPLPPLPPLPGGGSLPGLPGLPPLPPIFGMGNPAGTAPGTGAGATAPQAQPSVPLGIPSEIYSLFYYKESVPMNSRKKAKDVIK